MGAVPPTAPLNGSSRGRVLVVDDDAALAEMLGIVLRREGYEPAFVSDGNRAVGVFHQTRPDLVLLDLMLPGRNGLQICQDIRTQSSVPIVMLTAKGDTIDVVQGLEAGADDYVTKPFKPVELVARVRAQLRRGETTQAENLSIGDVQIDVPAHQVTRDGTQIALTPLEFDLLVALARKPRQVFTRELLLEQVWGYRHAADTRLVNVHVQRLRAKIDRDPEEPEGSRPDRAATASAGWHRVEDVVRRLSARAVRAWRSSLQVRIGAITMAVAGTVVVIISVVLFIQIRDQLLSVKRQAAIDQMQ